MTHREVGTRRLWRSSALGLSMLCLVTALAVGALAAPTASQSGRTWLFVGWLGIPAAGTLWTHISNRRASDWLVFLWIFCLATSIGALVAELAGSLGTPEFGSIGAMILVGMHAATALLATGPPRRSR